MDGASLTYRERLDALAAARSPLMASARGIGAAIMPALLLRSTPVREGDSALVHVLEAYIETLKAENDMLKRRLAAVEAQAGRETANAQQAIAEFSAITKRLRARADALGDAGSRNKSRVGLNPSRFAQRKPNRPGS